MRGPQNWGFLWSHWGVSGALAACGGLGAVALFSEDRVPCVCDPHRTSFKATPPPPGALRGVVCCPRGKAAAFRGSAFFPPFSVDLRSWTALFFCDVL